MFSVRAKLLKWLLRSYQKDINNIRTTLTKEQTDGLLSMMYQNEAFRNYIVLRENALCLLMANEQKKPSDDEYMVNYGKRLALSELFHETRLAYHRLGKNKRALTQERDKPSSEQAQA